MANVLTLGEILLRLSTPTGTRLSTAKQLDLNYGGAEANTAISLAIFGHETTFITRLPDHALTIGMMRYLKGLGVNTNNIIKGGKKVGSYFLDVGVGQRASEVIYDRAGSAFSELTESMIDLDTAIDGYDLIHLTGITPALSQSLQGFTLKLMKKANEKNIPISFDFNFRQTLWSKEQARSFFTEAMPYLTHVSLSPWDMTHLLGYDDLSLSNRHEDTLNTCYKRLIADYPNIQTVYATKRLSPSASKNDLTGYFYTNGTLFSSETYTIDPIIDRVGGGDAFASGILHGILSQFEPDKTVTFATQASVLKHYISGDANLVTEQDVLDVMAHGAQIKR
ncbi:2-dehydro-3-deoxygluconokinase [Halolactibacillus miurensis]|uniref:2-dehydro-3-deoxygluconokinase n=1 Tax=Halolactibacillus miurensis TaxID=306541 RepID=A0A1I6Q4R5_9BACI|nr:MULTISPECIES: sugar kinase [Halolactibacillus]GEM03287.1 2-dehydro-3-deoxygluconokinase [Halolactibacillus miurensis]SFS47471.1 2-dehydro-3-deoxygluconokinase [Halolactibacillus miurensis]